ncbi:response regulator [Sphingomonas spermidinifaciens]|uniref:Response regulator n=1 Tax=Sphingomonas spermidinifaciens TaxID=1141889 RepID=A0A2A4B838_9SPHN|nr:response regulator [Sphingomonas spermidinifaciens]PCD04095.1 response regulator [Sphingomonas spermidinifaciens]
MAHILVADDDPLLSDLVRFRLEAVGHRLTLVEDGQAALATIRADRPDILILDAMMPILSGQQLLQTLKGDPDLSAIPVIMLTARKGQDDIMNALQSGADDYITKPFLPDELVLRIERLLARRG